MWPARQHAADTADRLRARPAGEPLNDALVAAILSRYESPADHGLPPHWLRDFRALLAAEPALHGEYLKASALAERALADAIAERMGRPAGDLGPRVLAGMVTGGERAAVMYWMQTRVGTLADSSTRADRRSRSHAVARREGHGARHHDLAGCSFSPFDERFASRRRRGIRRQGGGADDRGARAVARRVAAAASR